METSCPSLNSVSIYWNLHDLNHVGAIKLLAYRKLQLQYTSSAERVHQSLKLVLAYEYLMLMWFWKRFEYNTKTFINFIWRIKVCGLIYTQCLLTSELMFSPCEKQQQLYSYVNRNSPLMPTLGKSTSQIKDSYRFMCHPAGQLVAPCAKHELALTVQQSALFIWKTQHILSLEGTHQTLNNSSICCCGKTHLILF